MLIFSVDDDSYIEYFNEFVDYLSKNSLYEMIGYYSVEAIQQCVSDILDMISENVSVSFATDSLGTLTSISLGADDFIYAEYGEEAYINFSLDFIVNGRIDATWYDIIEKIENSIVSPDEEMLDDDINYGWGYGNRGYVTYKGVEYWYSDAIQIKA